MNAMIRALKGTLAVLALAGLGWLLRWMTAGSISGLRTYDLDSLTVLAVGTIAWIAYSWLALAVVLTVLEQVPGVVGELAGAVAGRITTKTARALLRSGLGVAAVTPLTITAAHATPDTTHVRHTTQTPVLPATYRAASRPEIGAQNATGNRPTDASALEIGGQNASDYRATEAASSLEISGTTPHQTAADYRATEAPSTLGIARTPHENTSDYRATEPASALPIGDTPATARPTNTDNTSQPPHTTAQRQTADNYRTTEPASTLPITQPTPAAKPTPSHTTGSADRVTSGRPANPSQTPTPSKPTGPAERTNSGNPTRSTESGRGHGESSAGSSDKRAGSNRDQAGSARTGSGRTSDGKPGATERRPGGRVGVPDRPTDGAPTRYTDLRPNLPVSVVVRAGDSLWSIAARELGPTATPEAITARWHAWYAANRHVIGSNPDLILPGQVLRTPPTPKGDHLPPHPQEQ